MKIKEINQNLRPREKALNYGLNTLLNQELLAILFSCGSKKESCLDLSCRILNKYNFLQLSNLSIQQLKDEFNISELKALQIATIGEIAKRLSQESIVNNALVYDSSEKIVSFLRTNYGFLQQENFIVLYLDSCGHLIKHLCLFKGTINATLVNPREIFKNAYIFDSVMIVLAHNHPSGICKPSNEDINITKKILNVSYIMGIKVIDHIIFSTSQYFSMAKNGLLQQLSQ